MAASLKHQQNDPCEEDGIRVEAGYECEYENMWIGV